MHWLTPGQTSTLVSCFAAGETLNLRNVVGMCDRTHNTMFSHNSNHTLKRARLCRSSCLMYVVKEVNLFKLLYRVQSKPLLLENQQRRESRSVWLGHELGHLKLFAGPPEKRLRSLWGKLPEISHVTSYVFDRSWHRLYIMSNMFYQNTS